jgi:hypothetical protein
MSHEWVTAIATAVSAVTAVVLVYVAIKQLSGLRDQLHGLKEQIQATHLQITNSAELDKRRNTLEAIQRYEKDPIVHGAMKSIWDATANGTDYTKLTDSQKFHAFVLLNYLDGIAVGIHQDVYIEQMVKDYLQLSVHKAVKALIKGHSGDGWKAEKSIAPESGYKPLCALHDKWFPEKGPEYRAR